MSDQIPGTPNRVLKMLLQEFQLTQQGLADQVNQEIERMFGDSATCTGVHVRRWLSGAVCWPHAKYLIALESIFGESALDLGFIPRGRNSIDSLARKREAISSSCVSSNTEDPVRRRELLTAIAGTAGTVLLSDILTRSGGRIGVSEIEILKTRLARLHQLDWKYGGGDLSSVAIQESQIVANAIRSCRYSDRTLKMLYSMAGEFTASAGWFAQDSGNQRLATDLYNQAMKIAAIADDRLLQAHILNGMIMQSFGMVMQPMRVGEVHECVAISRAVLDGPAVRQCAQLASLFHARLAVGLAYRGEGRLAAREFAHAERALNTRDASTSAPSWLKFFGAGELSGLMAQGALATKDYQGAVAAADDSVKMISSDFPRNVAMHTITQAHAWLGFGDAEQACSKALAILDTVPRIQSARGIRALNQFREKVIKRPSAAGKQFLAEWDERGVATL